MSSFPPHDIPGRPYASSHFCWSVNNEMQKPTYANRPCPSPSTQISSKDRELLGTDSGLETETQLLQLLWKHREMVHKMYFAWSKKCCPPTKQLPWCQQKRSNDLSLRVFKVLGTCGDLLPAARHSALKDMWPILCQMLCLGKNPKTSVFFNFIFYYHHIALFMKNSVRARHCSKCSVPDSSLLHMVATQNWICFTHFYWSSQDTY